MTKPYEKFFESDGRSYEDEEEDTYTIKIGDTFKVTHKNPGFDEDVSIYTITHIEPDWTLGGLSVILKNMSTNSSMVLTKNELTEYLRRGVHGVHNQQSVIWVQI